MIAAIALLFLFQLLGEGLHRALGLPLPGAVIGMVLLVGWLALAQRRKALVPARLEAVTNWLTAHLSVMLVPAAVGIMEQGRAFALYGVGIVLATAASTVLTIVVTAVVFRWALARFAPASAGEGA